MNAQSLLRITLYVLPVRVLLSRRKKQFVFVFEVVVKLSSAGQGGGVKGQNLLARLHEDGCLGRLEG